MKKVLITQRLVSVKEYKEYRECLDIEWNSFLNQCEILPIALPLYSDINHYFKLFDIDGVILSGGNDLYSVSSNELSLKRDQLEKKLIDIAIEKQIPILGVCRGTQIINEYFNGSLKKVQGQVATRIKLDVNKSSKYAKFFFNYDEVNSYHDYGLDEVCDEFLISTVSGSSIKAIEHIDKNILGIMWHPEREKVFNKTDIELFKSFFGDE